MGQVATQSLLSRYRPRTRGQDIQADKAEYAEANFADYVKRKAIDLHRTPGEPSSNPSTSGTNRAGRAMPATVLKDNARIGEALRSLRSEFVPASTAPPPHQKE
jgi:hypothetical protein